MPAETRMALPNFLTSSLARADQDGTLSVSCIFPSQQLWSRASAHNGAITALAWSLDGAFLASGGCDGMVHVWHATTGSRLCSFKQGEEVQRLRWSPGGILAASSGGSIRLWPVRQAQTAAA